jgi:uncharacterized protein YjiS (DUF1127 family)
MALTNLTLARFLPVPGSVNPPQGVVADWAAEALRTLVLWELRLRTRHALSRLDTARCADIGIDPALAAREAAKPFWKA